MSFLSRIKAASEDTISVDEIYSNDPQLTQLANLVLDLIYKFAIKFKIEEIEVLRILMKKIEKEL